VRLRLFTRQLVPWSTIPATTSLLLTSYTHSFRRSLPVVRLRLVNRAGPPLVVHLRFCGAARRRPGILCLTLCVCQGSADMSPRSRLLAGLAAIDLRTFHHGIYTLRRRRKRRRQGRHPRRRRSWRRPNVTVCSAAPPMPRCSTLPLSLPDNFIGGVRDRAALVIHWPGEPGRR